MRGFDDRKTGRRYGPKNAEGRRRQAESTKENIIMKNEW
jgi:hypothetical protein